MRDFLIALSWHTYHVIGVAFVIAVFTLGVVMVVRSYREYVRVTRKPLPGKLPDETYRTFVDRHETRRRLPR